MNDLTPSSVDKITSVGGSSNLIKTPRSTSKIPQQTKIDVTVTLTENKSHKKVG